MSEKRIFIDSLIDISNEIDRIFKYYNQIPWSKISGMRNKLIHEYFGVDLETLWNTIKNRLREIKQPVEEILNSFNTKK
jgi:uncharacterized protein with HEPN domain